MKLTDKITFHSLLCMFGLHDYDEPYIDTYKRDSYSIDYHVKKKCKCCMNVKTIVSVYT